MTNNTVSIFFHNYYGNHSQWLAYFKETIRFEACLYYNINEDSMYTVQEKDANVFKQFQEQPGSFIKQLCVRTSSNKGKDIGGKLVLLDAYIRQPANSNYGLFLHDKRSPYKADSETWRTRLFSIAEEEFSNKAMQLFNRDQGAGIITAAGNVKDEYDYERQSFSSKNRVLLPSLQESFNIHPPSFQYVTGTMFWCRMKPLVDFFTLHAPLDVRKALERGNVMDEYEGSYTHSWERLLCWLVTAQQYVIKTI